ncbi:AAA family ATPase [Methylococcus geothermalis]|uniref:AAA family ATPase n=1 Tax=Methylococcus geothermalis TaxID=2681310 RepID=A0A858QB71_9GAMM|nr:AAA family ATPase [Methylococcus geothermalis]QJD30965.1 AAA family ATPase [Methylococcus geothermalis]
MSFQKMKLSLVNAYDRNVQVVRMKQLISDGHVIIGDHSPGKLRIPVLSGLTGIGKTACVTEFATEKDFELIKLDCSYMPSSTLATFMYSAINRILAGQINGCVLLIDNINEADSEWLELFDQYSKNYFDAPVNIADDANQDRICKTRERIDEIPEGLFIVGEQRPS